MPRKKAEPKAKASSFKADSTSVTGKGGRLKKQGAKKPANLLEQSADELRRSTHQGRADAQAKVYMGALRNDFAHDLHKANDAYIESQKSKAETEAKPKTTRAKKSTQPKAETEAKPKTTRAKKTAEPKAETEAKPKTTRAKKSQNMDFSKLEVVNGGEEKNKKNAPQYPWEGLTSRQKRDLGYFEDDFANEIKFLGKAPKAKKK